jgi:sterol desaturase/sphingolipid hydroxylase (fatty acid hydroxylase superfamily)
MDDVINLFSDTQQWVFESLVQPLMFYTGLGNLLAEGYNATGWLLVGVVQILVMLLLIGPLQRWRPVEALTDRATVRVDMLYTLIHRLGVFRLALFFSLDPVLDALFGAWRVAGLTTFHLDAVWPGVTDHAVISLLMYLLVMDALDYGIHRGQHRFEWWWRLHSLHHAQRQMTMWSDNRNHLLDDVIRSVIVVVVAQLIGIAPSQFVVIVALTQLSESFHHANLRLWFGRFGERLWVSPRFHRQHHSMQDGQHNFGVLLPWWDMLCGTANFEHRFERTGLEDQVAQGRDYGRGFWSQQWLGFKRLAGRA